MVKATMLKTKIIVSFCLLACLFTTAGCAGSGGDKAAKATFKRGRQLVVTGRYARAIPVLQEYLQTYPKGKHASKAGLFLGKAHLALGQFEFAKQVFAATSENYPGTLEGHKCRYKYAVAALLQGEEDDALARFTALARDPDGPLAPEATAMRDYLLRHKKRPEPQAFR